MLTCGVVSGQTHVQHEGKPVKKKSLARSGSAGRHHEIVSSGHRRHGTTSKMAKSRHRHYARSRAHSIIQNTVYRQSAPLEVPELSTADLRLDLQKQKGGLPWPSSSRNISAHFGMNRMDNGPIWNSRGIVLDLSEGESVNAVADGMVSQVLDLEGGSYAVLVKHGRYFTVYNNLATACVEKGDQIKAGQELGRMDETGQLEFYICDNRVSWLDPEKWLKR